MAPTLRTVVQRPSLGLSVRTGGDALDRPVRWVAVSELEDPTPFLEGGELVLTTGMPLDAAGAGPYVGRLVARGVSGLGFGVGLGHGTVPAGLLAAADRAGLPLLEVPRETPFVAVGKAVSDLLAAEQYEEITRAFAAQGRLTRAALRPEGARAVVDRLARELGGWAVLLDEAGAVRHAAGRGAAAVGAVLPELGRLRGRAREGGRAASLALSTPGEHVVVQPVGARRAGGFFAVGLGRPFTPVEHTVVNAAGSLLTLALEHGREHLAAERRVRAAALRLLLAGQTAAGRETLERLGDRFPDGPLVVLAAGGDREAVLEAVLETVPELVGETAGQGFAVAEGDRVLVLVPAAGADEAVAALAGRAGACPLGVGAPVGPEDLRTGIEQADRALASARGPAGPVVRFADLAGRGLLALLDAGAAAAFSAALLAPLREYGSRADLVESLRAYLACNGHWDAAAQRLGVHRHTLRYRMRRVAELLGRDLDDPAVRAELWVALSV
ncbi:PucR family transcriptional regulator [Planomonospora sp. ID82291]|uniref:PucR family transcriptional regulator n=1 Tax=Planomonospora sp. ID82291 TaxID=2738136 RepID=UPI0018C4086C|nr:PucR family transcriptional regulator [Planomonospora sp. ID82291]MBG0815806.1 PucR family transcriptional regulator [Planomonospora sp. ID82291]